jgi:hypothetical protein
MDEAKKTSDALVAVYRKAQAMYESIGPVPNRMDVFMTMLHGEGWKERALAVLGPQAALCSDERVRDLEMRIARIERHLKLGPADE